MPHLKDRRKLIHNVSVVFYSNYLHVFQAYHAKTKQLLLVCAVVEGQSVMAADKKPLTKEESAKVIEAAIRKAAKKPTGELTKADYKKVTRLSLLGNQLTSVKGLEQLTQLKQLNLRANQLTDVKGLEKLTQLEDLWLENNPDLTKAQIAELQKALPNCFILSNPKK